MESHRNLDWLQTLEFLSEKATSQMGRDSLLKLAPLPNADAALESFAEIQDLRTILVQGFRPFMKGLDLSALWLDRIKKSAVLKTMELKDVRLFCLETIALKELLESHENLKIYSTYFEQLMDAEEPLSAIDRLMTASGEIRTDASERLYGLFKEKTDLERQIRTNLEKLVRAHEMEHLLQDRFVTNREGRWVLPIKSGMQGSLDGIIHDASQTKQTVFMEPEVVVRLNNNLREVNIRIDEEIERLLKEISAYLSTLSKEFETAKALLLHLDIRFAQAQFSESISANPPELSAREMDLKDLRHPLLVLNRGLEAVVSNPVRLTSAKSILLLSGPNAGGKTVLLKAVGLAAQMARCGLPICAKERSSIPFFKVLFSAIGDSQSVDSHLSTFAAHLKLLNEAAIAEGEGHLILIDEICGSTDPEEGSALARSFIEHYAKKGMLGVVTSHLGPLKEGWRETDQILTASMEFDDTLGRPTFQLIPGIFGRSMALKTASRVGVLSTILQRAMELISPEARQREHGLSELESQRTELHNQRETLVRELRQSQDLRQKYQTLIEKFKSEREIWLKKSVDVAEKQIEKLLSEMKAASNPLVEAQRIKAQLPQIVKASTKPQIASAEDFAKLFPPGSTVFIPSLNQDGLIQSLPNAKGEVQLQAQSLRVALPWSVLQAPKNPTNPTARLTRRHGIATSILPNDDRTLDLRGNSVEEALQALENSLDRAVQNQEDRVKIVHGHGTETLKRAIRSFLSRSLYVKKWKAGTAESGGDGITWVELD
ncbi:MAG: Smr/MutS family protein [Bdellovibrionales bacterium]|nr:Smr/MutS family protein [Bdellovibrionales bacterium]